MRQRHSEKGSFLRVIRRQPGRLLALTGLGLVFVALFASAATPAPATHFVISGTPESTTAGDFFSLTVTAFDGELVDTEYTGTVQFTSTDNGVQTVLPDDYTFTTGEGGDNGTHTFTDLTKLTTAGLQTVTASDGEIEGTSDSITVTPGPLGSLTITDPVGPLTAGEEFSVTVSASDVYGNAGADGYWNGTGCVVFLSLISPPPALKQADDPAQGDCSTAGHSELTFDSSGQAPADITHYRATTTFTVPSTQTLTVRAEGKEASTTAFEVNPGTDLFRFRWTDQPGASQTAGQVFDRVEVSAYDEWDNIKTDYNPAGAVFSGLNRSPSGCNPDHVTPNPSGTDGCDPVYNLSFVNGIANSTTVKDYRAETTQLTVTDGSISASSDSGTPDTLTVAPNAANTPPTRFSEEPTLTERNVAINNPPPEDGGPGPGVQVTVEDAFGNPREGDNVTVAIDTDPPGGSMLGGTKTKLTNASGIATFDDLTIDKVGIGFRLKTTAPVVVTSNPFDIANDVATCTGTCSATGSTPNRNTATVDAFGLGGAPLLSRLGPAASAQSLSARLGMTVAGGTSITLPPNTSCGNLAPIGDPFWITTFESEAGDPPSYKVVARLGKSLQKKSGATKYDICLGAINVSFPPPAGQQNGDIGNGCTNPQTSNSWPTKNGTCAKFFNGFYWGLVRDYPSSQVNNTTGCPGSPTYPTGPPFNLFPGVYQKQKNGNDIVISLCKPSDWDGGGGWR